MQRNTILRSTRNSPHLYPHIVFTVVLSRAGLENLAKTLATQIAKSSAEDKMAVLFARRLAQARDACIATGHAVYTELMAYLTATVTTD